MVRDFAEKVLVGRHLDLLETYLDDELIQHNPETADGVAALRAAMEATVGGDSHIRYTQVHRVLAEGNFVLCMSEGYKAGVHTSFYDLFRVADGKVMEHWDTIETIAPRSEWKNENGKF